MDIADYEAPTATVAALKAGAKQLPSLDDPAFGAVFDRFSQSGVVLLGEASTAHRNSIAPAPRSRDA